MSYVRDERDSVHIVRHLHATSGSVHTVVLFRVRKERARLPNLVVLQPPPPRTSILQVRLIFIFPWLPTIRTGTSDLGAPRRMMLRHHFSLSRWCRIIVHVAFLSTGNLTVSNVCLCSDGSPIDPQIVRDGLVKTVFDLALLNIS